MIRAPRNPAPTVAIPRPRRGFSLPEMLFAMTLGAVVFGLSVELLSVAMHADSVSGQTTFANQSIDRLAEQFRDDVRQATAVRPMNDTKKAAKQKTAADNWTIEWSDGRSVEYSQNDHLLMRTEFKGEKISARDAFALGDGVTARVALRPVDHPTVAELILSRGADRPTDNSPIRAESSLRVAASIGWDRRFAVVADKPQAK